MKITGEFISTPARVRATELPNLAILPHDTPTICLCMYAVLLYYSIKSNPERKDKNNIFPQSV